MSAKWDNSACNLYRSYSWLWVLFARPLKKDLDLFLTNKDLFYVKAMINQSVLEKHVYFRQSGSPISAHWFQCAWYSFICSGYS